NHLKTGGYNAAYKNPRTMNMENSEMTVHFDFDRAWEVDGDNFNLYAYNSTLYNESFMGTIMTEYGEYFEFWNVELNGPVDSLANKWNTVEYNVVSINMESGLVTGNFIADSILIKGNNSGIFKHSTTNVVIIDGQYGSINEDHDINRCFVNKFGFIRGNNEIEYCIFNDDGVFMGQNVFDTLVLYPGQGDFQNQGNWFYFQADSVQTITDSLYIRGNQCSNINITSLNPPKIAYLKQDYGEFDVSCDYLNIYSVGAQSETLEFYAGLNSTPLPDPDDPPPGWIFDNAQGYIFGFDGKTERFCLGDTYTIEATNFNGDPSTQYFWEGSQYPGGPSYTITEPGQYHLRVQYFEGCYVDDYINIEADFPPVASIDAGPFCEGDPIYVYVSPDNNAYHYEWFNQDTTSFIIADLSYTGGISVTVLDTTNGCDVTPNQTILVKPSPEPEVYLGDDVTLKFGESITMDAGPGTFYSWSADPEPPNPIPNPDERYITVPGYAEPNPIVYIVIVDLEGCIDTAFKEVGMFPPSKLGVPTAFSPNGDDVNPELKVYGSGFKELIFRVYDRYGKLVFETNDKDIGWDGTVNGQKQEMEVYTWYVRVIYEDGGIAEETGNVTLLR
ncbi:MAG: gliding motility-associated C-terminal domain-containing protein, partial [Bacteroidales bacterium]|nr:gliding motility-associated C-terminal domain-containing protein [Bacteroidales bacterium]